jgi:glutaconate CoA-transferase, subunit A
VDELIGGGCVARLEIAYAGTGRFAPTCVRFRKAVQSGALAVEDYSNYQMTLRFAAGPWGSPFCRCARAWARISLPGGGSRASCGNPMKSCRT